MSLRDQTLWHLLVHFALGGTMGSFILVGVIII